MIDRQCVILLVDDHWAMRTATAQQLASLGVGKVLLANDGAEALALLKQERVDAVLSNWQLPEMNGLELLKAVRGEPDLCGLPVLLVAAAAEREYVAEAIASGVSDVLIRPFTSAALAARIEKALGRRGAGFAWAEPAAASQAERPGSAKKNDRPTILVVDDTPDNLQLLSHLFKDEYRVRTVLDGRKALDICCSDAPPDLVLLDVVMPDMDGFTVLQRMREHPNAETIPVIFVTAMSGEEARLRGLELGAVDFVAKPVDPPVVKARVRNFLRYVELHRRLQADFDQMMETARLRDDVERMTRHDMTGPLSGIMRVAQALADDAAVSAELSGRLRMIEESALHLLDLVNRSSELYKIETGRYEPHPQPVAICDVLRRIVGMAQKEAAAKQVDIVCGELPADAPPPRVHGDAMLCYSLFHNLLKNACEAAPPHSTVAVSLTPGEQIVVDITNKGAVPPAVRARFFEKFATAGKAGGTGLGTYSAKLLVKAQGGSIAMRTSDADDATTLTVSLPRYPGE